MQFRQETSGAGVFHNITFLDNGHIAAQTFRFFEIMGGQDDGGTLLVDGLFWLAAAFA